MTIAEEVDHLLRSARLAEQAAEIARGQKDIPNADSLTAKAQRLRATANSIDPEHKSRAWGCE